MSDTNSSAHHLGRKQLDGFEKNVGALNASDSEGEGGKKVPVLYCAGTKDYDTWGNTA